MRPYIVNTPAFDPKSGGCRVIHRFVHELNVRGQEAYTANKTTNPEWNTPYYGQNRGLGVSYDAWRNERDVIGVYPEITFGNPLQTRTVVRYLLNNAGKLSGPKHFDSTDILFAFSHMFNDFNLPEERVMFMPMIDTDIYKDLNLERDKISFYIGKGWRTTYLSETSGGYEVIRETSLDPHKLSWVFQTSKIFYSYDNITAMTELARLCGAPTVIIPNGEYSKEQYDKHELGWDGLGWGVIPPSFDSQKFRERYLGLRELFYKKLDNFIEITQNS